MLRHLATGTRKQLQHRCLYLGQSSTRSLPATKSAYNPRQVAHLPPIAIRYFYQSFIMSAEEVTKPQAEVPAAPAPAGDVEGEQKESKKGGGFVVPECC